MNSSLKMYFRSGKNGKETEDGPFFKNENISMRAVVVAPLAERSLSTSEVRNSNPVIGKLLYGIFI